RRTWSTAHEMRSGFGFAPSDAWYAAMSRSTSKRSVGFARSTRTIRRRHCHAKHKRLGSRTRRPLAAGRLSPASAHRGVPNRAADPEELIACPDERCTARIDRASDERVIDVPRVHVHVKMRNRIAMELVVLLRGGKAVRKRLRRSEEHTSELQSR